MTALLTAPCHGCHRTVRVDRMGSQVRVMERRGKTMARHRCEPSHAPDPLPGLLVCRCGEQLIECPGYGGHLRHGSRCGAWMPQAKEHCARRAGHSGTLRYPDHRTRYAMDCAAEARRKWPKIGTSQRLAVGAQ